MRRILGVLSLLAVLAACGGSDDADSGGAGGAAPQAGPSATHRTLTPVQLPPRPPPTGKLIADVEQWFLDTSNNRFEVYVENDTDADITPIRVTYHDQRFRTGLPGTRLRDIPSQSRRGFPVYIPDRPNCAGRAAHGTVTVDYTVNGEQRSTTVPTLDETDVIDKVTSARCLELSIGRIAQLSWADEVTASGDGGKGSVGTLTLVIDTTGRPGSTLVIDSVTGNPVFSPGDLGVFDADLTVTGDQPPQRLAVPFKPARCDVHAFGEASGFTSLTVNVHLDGEPGQLLLKMSPTTASNATTVAKASCGLLTSIGGGEG